jgi:hypothetical protein
MVKSQGTNRKCPGEFSRRPVLCGVCREVCRGVRLRVQGPVGPAQIKPSIDPVCGCGHRDGVFSRQGQLRASANSF